MRLTPREHGPCPIATPRGSAPPRSRPSGSGSDAASCWRVPPPWALPARLPSPRRPRRCPRCRAPTRPTRSRPRSRTSPTTTTSTSSAPARAIPPSMPASSPPTRGPSRSTGWSPSPRDYQLEDVLVPVTLEERIYRLRCVEAWSMVIPWVGFPLADLLKRVEPQGSAKYVAFETLLRPEEMPGVSGPAPAARLALCRGAAPRRGDAPADHPRRRALRRDAAQPERRADPAGGALEVRLQEHQVDRPDQPGRGAAADHLEPQNAAASTASIPT